MSKEQRSRLDALSKKWKRKLFPDGWREQNKYCRFRSQPDDIQEALKVGCPRLLYSEARILRDDFGIKTGNSPGTICRREDGGYSVTWRLRTTSRKGTNIFCNKIGFPQIRKQKGPGRRAGTKRIAKY